MPKDGLFAQVPEDLRVGIKIAAIRERTTVRELVTRVLTDWLQKDRCEEKKEAGPTAQ
jgi:hypothetical protein